MKLFVMTLMLLAGAQGAGAEDVSILIKNFDFGPMNATVAPGTTVVWKNLDGEPHTVASADGIARAAMVTPSIPGSSAGGTSSGPGPGPLPACGCG